MDNKLELNVADATKLAVDLFQAAKFKEAEGIFRALVENDPRDMNFAHMLGTTILEQSIIPGEPNRSEDALQWIDKAGEMCRNELVAITMNKGKALGEMGRTQEAFNIYDGLVRSFPRDPLMRYNRGLMLMQGGAMREAITDFDVALAMNPGDGKARFGKGFANLVLGNYDEGFRDYEHRLKDEIVAPEAAELTYDDLGNLKGKHVLIHGEQGHGDDILFSRYVPSLKARGAVVYMVLHPGVGPLLEGHGVTVLSEDRTTWPRLDYWIRMMSLAYVFRTTENSVVQPLPINYDEDRRRYWRNITGHGRIPKIGLCWSGSKRSRYDAHRSMPLKKLAPLLQTPGVHFFAIQPDVRESDQAAFETFTRAGSLHEVGKLRDFADTACLMKELDLVITVDTSVAHLAGTVGVDTIVMLTAFRTYWMWIEKKTWSPWYPKIELVRQLTDGDWNPVLEYVADRVKRLTERKAA